MENPVHNIPVVAAWGSDCSSQLVGSAPQQAGRAFRVEEVAETRLTSVQGQRNCVEGHQSPSALQLAEGVCLPPPWTEGHRTLMGTPWRVRPQAAGIGARATEGVRRRSGWCL